jgi:DNA (cytosine-5)-methyltransferase 1
MRELIVDNFAGGGGASLGIEWALGRSPDIAINHDPEAVAMHQANHPRTKHYCESVWDVDPREVCAGRPVGLAWFSPDCKHFSKAKGGRPTDKKIRGLADVVIRWAREVRPRVIILENVEEFQTWGPLLGNGKPDPEREGLIFRRWRRDLERCGYRVDMRLLRACDFGAPTTRRRLFVVARLDEDPVWPEATHGPGLLPYLTAAECIDWLLPCPSIFLSREEARALRVKRPLAENTLRRIARGLRKYVLEAADPFVIPVTHAGDARAHSIREPMRTVTAAHHGEYALVAPTLIQTGYGERPGQVPRVPGLDKPLGTVVACGAKHALVTAFLARHFGGNYRGAGASPAEPARTITTKDHHALVVSHLMKLRGGLADHQVTAQDLRSPAPTITAEGTHLAEVRAFLVKYYGSDGSPDQHQSITEPLHTVPTRDRFGLVVIDGDEYVVADIGMRMLVPRELFLAQSFPPDYVIDPIVDGAPLSKEAQTRMCGNSVPPVMAQALALANCAQQRRRQVA